MKNQADLDEDEKDALAETRKEKICKLAGSSGANISLLKSTLRPSFQ